jgi:hypothetical protein
MNAEKYVQRRGRRDLYYKYGFLIDFPRTMNDLAKYDDSRYQAEIFGLMLSEQEHFARNDSEKEASAQVCSWNEFEDWLNKKAKEETLKVANEPQHNVPVKTDSAHTPEAARPKAPVIETIDNGSPGNKNKSSKEKEPDRKRSFLSFSLGRKGSKPSLGQRKS